MGWQMVSSGRAHLCVRDCHVNFSLMLSLPFVISQNKTRAHTQFGPSAKKKKKKRGGVTPEISEKGGKVSNFSMLVLFGISGKTNFPFRRQHQPCVAST